MTLTKLPLNAYKYYIIVVLLMSKCYRESLVTQ